MKLVLTSDDFTGFFTVDDAKLDEEFRFSEFVAIRNKEIVENSILRFYFGSKKSDANRNIFCIFMIVKDHGRRKCVCFL